MNTKTVAFVVYPGMTPLDLVGPLQVMSGLEVVETVFGTPVSHHVVVVAENLDSVPTDTPLRIAATTRLDQVPNPDIVVVPGGGAPTLRQLANPVLLDYLRAPTATQRSSPPSAPVHSCSPAPASLMDAAPPPTGRTTASSTASARPTCPSGWSRTAATSPELASPPASTPPCAWPPG
jgi:hypothetical protein